ncbi:MAG TPA: DUF1015 domain-containing protein [Streptosporangiaceae bacterium]|nr:DUF1015 domain-containing protein [Streptosporangiaceae bacterium]
MQIPPSSPASAGRTAAGLELTPFRGVRYAQDRVSGLAEVTSPPYDVIFRDKEDQLMAADPHNVVRLILPRPVPGRPGEEYHDAAESLRQWQDEDILVADPAPALYLYEQSAAAGSEPGWVQRGLIGAIRLVPPDAGVVLPHEDVAPGPVAGRLALMEATQANLEPIFLLYDSHSAMPGGVPTPNPCDGAVGATAKIIAEIAGGCEGSVPREPLISTCTSDGLRHKLWAITDPGELAAIADDLGPRQALIADGHHRYAAYLKLQSRRRQAGGGSGPWDYGLALLVDSASYPPQIGAIHRVIPGFDVQHAAKLAATAFTVRALPGGLDNLPAAVNALAAASESGPAFVLADGQLTYLISQPDPEQAAAAMPAGRSAEWRALPAAVMEELLITKLWELTDDDDTVQVVHHDAEAAVRKARAADGTAVLCSPMTPSEVYAVAARGEKVPRKSTSFAPKPRTGLVLRSFAQG